MLRYLWRSCILLIFLLLIGCSGGGDPVAPGSGPVDDLSPVIGDLTDGTAPPSAQSEEERVVGNFYYNSRNEETLAWGTVWATSDGFDYRLDYIAPRLQALVRSDVSRQAQVLIDLTWLNFIDVVVNYTNKPTPIPPDLATYAPGEFMEYMLDITNNIPRNMPHQRVEATQVDMFNMPLGDDPMDVWAHVNIPKHGKQLYADWTVENWLEDGIYYTRVRVGFNLAGGWVTILIFDSKAGAFKVDSGSGPEFFDPVARGVTTTPIVAVGENVHLQDNGSFDPDGGSITLYEWDFENDGVFDSVGSEADTSYPSPGVYYVNLRVTDDEGATDDLTDDPGDELIEITVTPPPVPPVAVGWASTYDGYTGVPIMFHGEDSYDPDGGAIVLYEWDWNSDGVYDQIGATLEHTYTVEGTYNVQLRVTDDELQTDTLDEPLEINITVQLIPPVACAEWEVPDNPDGPVPCDTVQFDASCSTDEDGEIALFEWDFDGDGVYDFYSSSFTAQHQYTEPGEYHVQLRVTDDDGQTDLLDEPLLITVENAPPTAEASANKYEAYINETIEFSGCESLDNDCDGQEIVLWEWDWENTDDWEDFTECEADHSYPDPGEYTVQLRVTDDEGGTAILDEPLIIVVSEEKMDPVAIADADPNPQTVCESVDFFDDGSYDPDGGSITLYEWDWNNDGVFDQTGSNASYTWDTPGTYYVQFQVTDDEGATDTLDSPLEIVIQNALPTALAAANKTVVETNEPVDFDGSESHDNDCNDSDIELWQWDFDYDGVTFDIDKTGQYVTNYWTEAGEYAVQLRVTDDEGATDLLDDAIIITVEPEDLDPVAYADADPNPADVCEDINFFDDGSYDPDGGYIDLYEWDWNNDGVYDQTGSSVYHNWDTPGTYYVQFRVTDDEGATDELDSPLEIVVENVAPTASASADKEEVLINEDIYFDGSESTDNDCDGVEIVSWEWDFDYDGSFNVDDTGETVTHSYDSPGVYMVQLRVTDDESATDMLDDPIEITVVLSFCPTGIHSFDTNRGVSSGYSLMGYSIFPRADIAYIESGTFAGEAIVQGGRNSLLILDPDADNNDPIDDGLNTIATGGGRHSIVTSLDSAPYANMVAVVTSDKPSELRLLDTSVLFGNNVVYTHDFGTGSAVMALDFDSGGELFAVVNQTGTSQIYLSYSDYAGAPDYYGTWTDTNITTYTGSDTDIFDIAINWIDDELYLFDGGVDSGSGKDGRLIQFSITNPLNPVVTMVGEDLFDGPIEYVYNDQFGVAGFADIEIDHMTGDDACHIVLHATVGGQTEIQKRDSNMVLLNADSPATYDEVWPSMSINPETNSLDRNLIQPGESTLGFWTAPSEW